ncbi:MAG: hypothetical protein KGI08_07205 [Thaumarchaeota archaeon]|nr:hypothetical protein [Nitrososphaerota archaeon]
MKYVVVSLFIVTALISSITSVYAQQPQLATYRETAHVLVDDVSQNRTSAFITLSTDSNLEMQVPTSLDKEIHDAQNVTSVDITNVPNCVLGVPSNVGCVVITMINPSLVESHDIGKIQANGQKVGDSIIKEINKEFSLDSQLWQVYVRPTPKTELSATPGTSNSSANISINAVYTFSTTKTDYLFDDFSSVLLAKQISHAGGFYDVAKTMASNNDSSITFAIIPQNNASLYQLQVARYFSLNETLPIIKPLQLFGINQLIRSSYFDVGFFPLNSLLDVTILSKHDLTITNHGGELVPTTIRNGQQIPTVLSQPGWIFDPGSGKSIFAVYLFGTNTTASNDELTLTIGNSTGQVGPTQGTAATSQSGTDYSTYALIGIVIAGGAAVYLFIKRK